MPSPTPDKNREYQKKWYANNKLKQLERNRDIKAVKQAWIIKFKVEKGCLKCDERHPAVLDFHHRESELKEESIAHMVQKRNFSLDKIQEEIKKCDVLCSNCHRKLHYEEKHGGMV